MDNKQTSDERLLNLIEGSQDPSRKQNIRPAFKKPTAGIFPFKFNLNSLKALKGIKVNLSGLNRGLIGVSCLLTLIFIYNIFSGPVVSKSNAAYFSPADATAVSKIISAVQAQGLMRKSILSQDIKRNIFLLYENKQSSYNQNDDADLTEAVKNFKLVGIIWSAKPEVMIENAKDSRTYLLKKGDSLNNDNIKVKDISRNSATLEVSTNDGPKEYELR